MAFSLAFRLALVLCCCLRVGSLTAATFTCRAGDTACVIDVMLEAQQSLETTLILEAGVYTLTAPDPDSFVEGPTGLPVVTSSVTIQGQGAAQTLLERAPTAPLFRLFTVDTDGVLTLRQLTVQGGAVDLNQAERGGGVLNFGTVLCEQTVLRNHTAWIGGALDNVGVFHGDNCAVNDNFADFVAAGVAALGPTTLDRSLLSRNISEADAGLSFDPMAGRVELRRTALTDNLATLTAGGALGGNGEALLVNAVLSGNLSALRGGAINFRGGQLVLRGSTCIGNAAVQAGGCLFVQAGQVGLVNTNIINNTAGLGVPGVGGGLVNRAGDVRLRHSTLFQNRAAVAPDCDGAIQIERDSLVGDRSGCTVTEP